MRKRIYIASDFLNWDCSSEGSQLLRVDEWRRAYDIWEHVEKKLHRDATEMDRGDAIIALKRCLNQRLKEIERAYRLKDYFGVSKKYLQLLERCGLVRPLILQNLMEIRNSIEHEDRKPPKLERCLVLLDVTWYFLRATDSITRLRIDSLFFGSDEDFYWASMGIQIKRTWKFSLQGWLPPQWVLSTPTPNCLEVMAEKRCTFEQWKKKEFDPDYHKDRADTDVYVLGEITALPDKMAFVKRYFTAF